MQDGCGRTIDYLRLSVTDLCNLRCRYCMPECGIVKRPHDDILSVEELVEIGHAAVDCGIRKIRLTGGEPLVRNGILDICRGLSAIEGLEELCLTTNGTLLHSLAKPLRKAGVHRLNVSLDTLVPEKYAAITRRGSLCDALDGLQAAERAGFSDLKLNTVLIGGFNDTEIADLVDLTRTHPWEVRFIELMPMGECADWEKRCFLSNRAVLDACPALEPVNAQGVAKRYRLPDAAGTVGLISPMSHEFCESCRRVRVTSDGKLKGCLHSREELNLRGLHGEALVDAIRQGIRQKPAHHHLTDGGSDTPRTMNQIGG
jgi:cyclic pyranopterin phosphate synthase